jgi:hypothetical protein
MMLRLVSGALLMTAACSTVPPEDEVPVHGGSGGTCVASKAQSLVGKQSSSAVGAEALRLSGARTLRWIPPGDSVTMDYREDRLNIDLDSSGKVRALRCG